VITHSNDDWEFYFGKYHFTCRGVGSFAVSCTTGQAEEEFHIRPATTTTCVARSLSSILTVPTRMTTRRRLGRIKMGTNKDGDEKWKRECSRVSVNFSGPTSTGCGITSAITPCSRRAATLQAMGRAATPTQACRVTRRSWRLAYLAPRLFAPSPRKRSVNRKSGA